MINDPAMIKTTRLYMDDLKLNKFLITPLLRNLLKKSKTDLFMVNSMGKTNMEIAFPHCYWLELLNYKKYRC